MAQMVQITTRPSTPLAGPRLVYTYTQMYAVDRSLTAEFVHRAIGIFVNSDGVDGVLMNRLELCVGLCLSLQIHLTEHVKCGLFADTASASPCLVLDTSFQLPPVFVSTQTIRLTILHFRVRFSEPLSSRSHLWDDLHGQRQ